VGCPIFAMPPARAGGIAFCGCLTGLAWPARNPRRDALLQRVFALSRQAGNGAVALVLRLVVWVAGHWAAVIGREPGFAEGRVA
jgi:hypothetical protein